MVRDLLQLLEKPFREEVPDLGDVPEQLNINKGFMKKWNAWLQLYFERTVGGSGRIRVKKRVLKTKANIVDLEEPSEEVWELDVYEKRLAPQRQTRPISARPRTFVARP